MLQDLSHIMPLREEETRARVLNMHTQEVVKDAEILHRELLLKGTSSLEQSGGGSCQHNVINIGS